MARPTFNRADTLLGVCEALGQDLGFNANWLRVALAVGMLWNPWLMVAAYGGLGAAVLVARLLTPDAAAVTAERAVAPVAENDDAVVERARAA